MTRTKEATQSGYQFALIDTWFDERTHEVRPRTTQWTTVDRNHQALDPQRGVIAHQTVVVANLVEDALTLGMNRLNVLEPGALVKQGLCRKATYQLIPICRLAIE